jgi:pimeloyl-ACP methyl ester carboxylesterase
MRRLIACVAGALTYAAWTASGAQSGAQSGRPVVLLVHGRGLQDRDSVSARKQWLDALRSGAATLTRSPAIDDADVRVVWYADVLDAKSSEGCDYASTDPRARRDAKTGVELKQVVAFAGGFINLISAFADDSTAKEIRALSADAAFLGDVRKRCASEARLGAAIDRATREGRPIILVAHSLGALMAYDYLSTRTDTGLIQRFITIGSMAGASELRRLVIGGDSTDAFTVPPSVKGWTNIRNEKDGLAVPLTIGRDIVTNPPPDEIDPHEMVGYLRGTLTAREILGAWCAALTSGRPRGCIDVLSK